MPDDDADLRSRLVAAGVHLVATEGMPALTLREIARRAGVSHGAPRRYFPTHLALLSAIAREGFADLEDRVADTLRTAGTHPRDRLMALSRTYLAFASSRRGMFELMFRHDLLESNRLGLREKSLPLFTVLVDLVAAARPPSEVPPPVIAGALWANLHGIALLWEWGSLPLATGAGEVDSLLRAALDAHLGADPRPGTDPRAGTDPRVTAVAR